MRFSKSIATLTVGLIFSACFACLNDRDTLAIETRDSGGVDYVKEIVGWFPVHSNLYYKKRIELSSQSLKSHPENLTLYDDIAVAYERMGDDVRAIQTTEQKRVYMVAHNINPKPLKADIDKADHDTIVRSSLDPWYRYYANAGTFWVHRWMHDGMPLEHKKEWLNRAQLDIDAAIKLNPLAHGLREYAQGEMIRWIRTGEKGQSFNDFEPIEFWDGSHTADALAGLVELGGAWESPDVYEALVKAFEENHMPTMAYFASLRVQELQKLGNRSLSGKLFPLYNARNNADALDESVYTENDHSYNWAKSGIPAFVDQDYAELRKAAESYRTQLQQYEVEKIEAGSHPDTDPNFWKSFHEPQLPVYGVDRDYDASMHKAELMGELIIGGIVLFFVLAIGLLVWRHNRMPKDSNYSRL